MTDPRDYKVELSGAATPADGSGAPTTRPYLSVHFACCGVYQRVYRDADGKAYRGRCPRCGTPVRFAVGDGGTSARCFIVR
jgi:hypothetical protein